MKKKYNDSKGSKYGKLTIIKTYYKQMKKRERKFALCKCDCGNITEVRFDCLTNNNTQSCGCMNTIDREKPNSTRKHKLYRVYYAVRERCYNTKNRAYKYYGERGIKMCDEWLKYENFLSWALTHGYKEGLQLDRINCNGNYEPNNCRWVDSSVNNYNKRNNILVLYKDGWRTIQYISDKEYISWNTAYYRYITKLKLPVKYLYGGGRIGGKAN